VQVGRRRSLAPACIRIPARHVSSRQHVSRPGLGSRGSKLLCSAVAAPPEAALAKGGPGATYGGGSVAKVCSNAMYQS
jgi:hypothetical protein